MEFKIKQAAKKVDCIFFCLLQSEDFSQLNIENHSSVDIYTWILLLKCTRLVDDVGDTLDDWKSIINKFFEFEWVKTREKINVEWDFLQLFVNFI